MRTISTNVAVDFIELTCEPSTHVAVDLIELITCKLSTHVAAC